MTFARHDDYPINLLSEFIGSNQTVLFTLLPWSRARLPTVDHKIPDPRYREAKILDSVAS